MVPEKFNTSDSDLESLIAIPNSDETNRLKYACEFDGCNKTFKRQTHLDRHVYHHDGIKKHVCFYDDCDKSYIISTHLKRHIQTFHEKFRKPKTFKCSIENCEKYFDSLFNVERHIANSHQNLKLYKCKICNKEFSRKLNLKRHEISAHNAEHPYKCNMCQKGYLQENNLKNHKCLLKESNYKCETCKELFPKWSLLIEHSKNQHDKAFVCSCCNKEFRRKVDIQNHERSMKRKQESINLKIECPYEDCDRTYNFQKNLKQHIKVKHLSKKFKCTFQECDRELASKQKLNQHIKKMHENTVSNKVASTKKRKPRKDIGIPKRSLVTQLSGIATTRSIEKAIIAGEAQIINVVEKENDMSISEAEIDDKVVGTVVSLEIDEY